MQCTFARWPWRQVPSSSVPVSSLAKGLQLPACSFQLPSQPVPARANRQPNFLARAPSASGAGRSPDLTLLSRMRLRAGWQGPAGEALGRRPCAHRANNIPQIASAPQIPSRAAGHTRGDARRAATLVFRVAVGRRQSKISKRSHGKAWGFWLVWSSGSSSPLQDDKTITVFTTTSVRKTVFRASACTASRLAVHMDDRDTFWVLRRTVHLTTTRVLDSHLLFSANAASSRGGPGIASATQPHRGCPGLNNAHLRHRPLHS